VFKDLNYRLAPMMTRWGNQAPAACCGVCKPCVSAAATGVVVAAAGLAAEAVSARRSGGEGHGASAADGAKLTPASPSG